MPDLRKKSQIAQSSDGKSLRSDSGCCGFAAESGHRELKPNNNLVHPASDLRTVLNDILRSGSTETYYFLDEGMLRRQVGIFRENFIPDMTKERRIIYAMKANPRKRIMEILVSEGIDGFDCASINEIDAALELPGVDPRDVYFNNPIRTPQSVTEALAREIRYFAVQSRSGVRKVLEGARKFGGSVPVELAVRLETQNPEAAINLSEKFGCSQKTALKLLRMADEEGARLGLSMHVGSQNPDIRAFENGISLLTEMAHRAGGVNSLNLGGGLPINYKETDDFDLGMMLRYISQLIRDRVGRHTFRKGVAPVIIDESGRPFAGPAVTAAMAALEVDERGGKKRVFINDGIFTTFSDTPIHGWRFPLEVFTRDGRKLSSHLSTFTVYGRTCDSGDVIGEYDFPSDLAEGDYFLMRSAGAYTEAQKSEFNGFGGPVHISYNT